MNIIEAVKLGYKFKRRKWVEWIYFDSKINHCYLLKEDLLADDYEIDEPKFLVTKSKLKEALIKFDSLDDICKYLGIEE